MYWHEKYHVYFFKLNLKWFTEAHNYKLHEQSRQMSHKELYFYDLIWGIIPQEILELIVIEFVWLKTHILPKYLPISVAKKYLGVFLFQMDGCDMKLFLYQFLRVTEAM